MWKPKHILKDEKVEQMRTSPIEHLALFYITEAIIGSEKLFTVGCEKYVSMPNAADIAEGCALAGSPYVVIVHSHPDSHDGNDKLRLAYPSMPDILQTEIYRRLLESFNVILMDHIVVTRDMHYSFKEHGLL